MQLENGTSFPAEIFRTVIDDTRIAAAVVLRVTYRFDKGHLIEADDQIWPVSGPPFDGPQGPMDSDEVFYRGGVDLFLFGHARAPSNAPVRDLQVQVALPGFRTALDIVGDRVWEKAAPDGEADNSAPDAPAPGALRPGPAAPFTSMPLCKERSFGGRSDWDALEVPYPENPDGKGFYLESDAALGAPLPNIEDPQNRLQSWDDRPVPVGTWMLPTGHPTRTRNGFLSADGSDAGLRPTLFNAAFPGFIAPAAAPGQWMRIDGMHPAGPIRFELPPAPLDLKLFFEPGWTRHTLSIDQIGIEVDEARAFITWRYPFRYTIHRQQKRRAVLVPAKTPVTAP